MNTPKSQKNSERLKANMEHLGRKVSLMFTSRQTSRSRTDLTEEIGVISGPTDVTHNTGIKAEEDGAIKGTLHSQREIYHFVGSILLNETQK